MNNLCSWLIQKSTKQSVMPNTGNGIKNATLKERKEYIQQIHVTPAVTVFHEAASLQLVHNIAIT